MWIQIRLCMCSFDCIIHLSKMSFSVLSEVVIFPYLLYFATTYLIKYSPNYKSNSTLHFYDVL